MTQRPRRNVAASVRARLLQRSRERGEDFQSVFTRYALERLLYRLARSVHRDEFVLKGALLFTLWTGEPHRATRDLDLLGRGAPDLTRLEAVFRALCDLAVEPDGLQFDPAAVRATRIRAEEEYEGVRVQLDVALGNARTGLQVDVGFGDAITPGPLEVTFPVLLDLPAPALRAYTRETLAAEKFHAIATLGMGNTRLKDFYDVWALAQAFPFDGAILAAAVRATFERRRSPVPATAPLALTAAFHDDAVKQTQWAAFLRKTQVRRAPGALGEVARALGTFLLPPTAAVARGHPFTDQWRAGGPWTPAP